MRELSFLNKGISLTITDKREQDDDGKDITATFLSEGGLSQFVELWMRPVTALSKM